MPDQPDPHPGDDEQLRVLLREARHEGPIPPEVAEQLDQALAGEPTPEHAAGTSSRRPAAAMIGLDRRRRRRAVALLVAAATIVAVGVGVGRLLRPGVDAASSSAGDIESRAGAASSREKVERGDAARDGDARQDGQAQPDPVPGSTENQARPGDGRQGAARERPPVVLAAVPDVSDEDFTRDVRRVRRLLDGAGPSTRSGAEAFACEGTDWGRGTAVGVRYEQAPSVLVLRPPAGETQVVDLVPCGTSEVLRSVTLPNPRSSP